MTYTNKTILFLFIFCFIVNSFTSAFSPVSASELVEDSWNTKTPMKQERANLGVVEVDGKIYAIGGYTTINYEWRYNQDGYVGDNERYDPVTDTWVTLEPMPTPRANFVIVAYQSKIYCIGGEFLNGPGTYVSYNITEVYDIATDSWSTKKDAPFDVIDSQAYFVDGQIFVVKGRDLFMYNTVTDEWTEKTSIPRPVGITEGSDIFGVLSCVMDNKIMVYFRYVETIGVPPWPSKGKVMIYDPKTDVWSEGRVPPNDSQQLLAGGWMTTGVYAPKRVYFLWAPLFGDDATPMVYDPVKNTWSTAESTSTVRTGFGVAIVNDVLYIIGGSPGLLGSGPILSLNEQYVPIGYRGTLLPGTKFPLNNTVIATVVLTLTVVVCLFFYFKKRSKEGDIM